MTSVAQKRKEKAQQHFQGSPAKSRELTGFFAASITPTNINYLKKPAMLYWYPPSKTKFSCLCCCKFIEYFVKI